MSRSHYLRNDEGNKPIPINDQVQIPSEGLVLRCTRELADAIALDIVKGGTPHIAAAVRGVSPSKFKEWLHLGDLAAESGDTDDPHGYLYVAIYVAAAAARLGAEQRVYARTPEAWLSYNLGRGVVESGVCQEVWE